MDGTRWGYKRFITPSKDDFNQNQPSSHKFQQLDLSMSGNEVRQFYEDILSEPGPSNPLQKAFSTRQKRPVIKSENSLGSSKIKSRQKEIFTESDLFRAVTTNDLNRVQKILEANPILVNSRDQYKWTTLMMAACEGHYEMCEYLLQLGIDVNAFDSKGLTALNLAEKKHFIQIIELLKSYKNAIEISSDSEDNDGPEEFQCSVCGVTVKENTKQEHEASTLHLFNMRSHDKRISIPVYGIPASNKGYQLMLKQGWDKNHGLGPKQKGKQYPVKTVIRKNRTGLGIKQKSARITHFGPYDMEAVKYRPEPKVRTRRDMDREKSQNRNLERKLRNELS